MVALGLVEGSMKVDEQLLRQGVAVGRRVEVIVAIPSTVEMPTSSPTTATVPA
jgi:hypothetical protein